MLMVTVSGVSLDPWVCFPPSFLGTVRKDFHLELILDMGGWAQHAKDERDFWCVKPSQVVARVA